VLRFSCPQCGKAFKLPGEKAGRPVVCPRCGERSVAPASAAAGRDEPERRSPSEESEQPRGLFRGMSSRVRWGVALVAGTGTGGLLLAGDWAVPLGVYSAVVFLAILHGHATGCPACGKWWSRAEVEKRLVAREGFDEGGVPCERLLDRTTYQCAGCGHRWSVTDTQEYWGSGRGRPQRHGG
jgi:DNA-directed RNA polymerase subunit RPC12/RpoP